MPKVLKHDVHLHASEGLLTLKAGTAESELPDDVTIWNPNAWIDSDEIEAEDDSAGITPAPVVVPEPSPKPGGDPAATVAIPPRAGNGSGKEAWIVYAEANGIEGTGQYNRDEIIGILNGAGIPTE